jgi:Domain of unknown function (DUF427)
MASLTNKTAFITGASRGIGRTTEVLVAQLYSAQRAREHVDFTQLEKTDHATYCPYKGDCNYYSVPAGGEKSVNAVWTYENRIPLLRRSRSMSPSIPTESMR